MPQANTLTMQTQPDDLGRSLGADVHALLVLDGAGWHVSQALRVPPNMTLLKLPPYAPELNPAEMLWRELRQRYLSNRLWPDIDALDSALATAWLRLSNDTERLHRLTNLNRINATVTQFQLTTDTSCDLYQTNEPRDSQSGSE